MVSMEKGEPEATGAAAWLRWLPAKLAELRQFFSEVKAELKKVSWPGKDEVRTTTIVVVATTIFFGFYLWSLDIGFSRVMEMVFKSSGR
jgi:preprotein translocase subunit SecE